MSDYKSVEERMKEEQLRKTGPHEIKPGESWGEGDEEDNSQDVRDDAEPAPDHGPERKLGETRTPPSA